MTGCIVPARLVKIAYKSNLTTNTKSNVANKEKNIIKPTGQLYCKKEEKVTIKKERGQYEEIVITRGPMALQKMIITICSLSKVAIAQYAASIKENLINGWL